MQQEQHKKLTISEIRQETNEVGLFYFDESSAKNIHFKAGQYLTFIFEDGEKESRRSYSIASSPVLMESLYVGIKRIPNGNFSRMLFDYAKPGDILRTSGAAGVFTLPDDINRYRQFFFFAAGSGIIPVFSLIKTLLLSYPSINLVLVYSNRSVAKAVFYDELNGLQSKYPGNLHIEFLFSKISISLLELRFV